MDASGLNKGKRKPLSEVHKRKLSEAHKGMKLSEDTKQKISLALQGNKRALGLIHTEQSKEKMSIRHKGQIPWNKGIKAWNNGHQWPDTVKDNISKGMILCWQRRKQKQEVDA